jgi:hypothetical protein
MMKMEALNPRKWDIMSGKWQKVGARKNPKKKKKPELMLAVPFPGHHYLARQREGPVSRTSLPTSPSPPHLKISTLDLFERES